MHENLFTDSRYEVTAVNFNSKNVYEDETFGRQDILQFYSGEFQRIQVFNVAKTYTFLLKLINSIVVSSNICCNYIHPCI